MSSYVDRFACGWHRLALERPQQVALMRNHGPEWAPYVYRSVIGMIWKEQFQKRYGHRQVAVLGWLLALMPQW